MGKTSRIHRYWFRDGLRVATLKHVLLLPGNDDSASWEWRDGGTDTPTHVTVTE